RGSKLNRATSPNATAADSVTKKTDSIIPVRKSRRALPLRNHCSPWEITLPIKTTGWGSQRGSPMARSKRKAPDTITAEEFRRDGQSIDIFISQGYPRLRGKPHRGAADDRANRRFRVLV